MSGIEQKGLDAIMAGLDRVLEYFPEKRRTFHNRAGEIILRNVKKHTPYDTSRFTKSHLRDGIYKNVGSKGGYVAIRADYNGSKTGYAVPHAHLIENGHVMVTKDGREVGFVKGVHMFEKGLAESMSELSTLVDEFADEMAGELEK